MWQIYLGTFGDPLLIVLLVCAAVSIATEMYVRPDTGWINGAAIFIAVQIVALVTTMNDYSQELQFRKLNAVKSDIEVKVVRGGKHAVVRRSAGSWEAGDPACLGAALTHAPFRGPPSRVVRSRCTSGSWCAATSSASRTETRFLLMEF